MDDITSLVMAMPMASWSGVRTLVASMGAAG